MKLYTTDQVIDIFEKYGNMSAINARNIIDLSESVKLPSDEEIAEMGKDVIIYNDTKRGWFVEGLKFMRDKIQGGNNEN